MKAQQIPAKVREIVKERSGGTCEACCLDWATQIHHRRPRALGGSRDPATNQPSNLIHLCHGCHLWVEKNREKALQRGLLVTQGTDPKKVPAFLHRSRKPVWLDDAGDFWEATDAELIEAAVTLPWEVNLA